MIAAHVIADRLRGALAALRADGPSPGRAWCEAWSDAVDSALVALHEASAHRDRVTLVATGGYGRRELCPGSDIDLLLLHEGLETPALEVAVRDVVYPLWDAGLTVGYAVRSRREAVEVADVGSVTATLDARLVSGTAPLVASVRDGLVRRLRRRPTRFLRALAAEDDDRHARAGHAAEVLAPDLKRGAGGLRDVQSLRWAAAALVGESRLDALVAAGHLGASDRGRLARAYDRILAERVALHLTSNSRTDVLALERQQEVAGLLGYVDGDDDLDTAAHRLLADHFLDARVVDHVHRRAWGLVRADLAAGRRRRSRPTEGHLDGFAVSGEVLTVPADHALVDAELPTRLFAALARSGAMLSRQSAQRLRHEAEALERPLAWSHADRERFLGTLWRGSPALDAAAELDDAGLLVALVPEWAPLRGRPQRNPYHRYSLDRHALHAAAALGDLVREEPWAARTFEDVADRDALMLGVLVHDIGKAHGEPHSQSGRGPAVSIAHRLGLGAASRSLVDTLVAEHLLLPETATRRDPTDPAVIADVTRRVDDLQTLACLHLLAAADGRATGPSAWTTWTATLVDQLVVHVRATLEGTTSRTA